MLLFTLDPRSQLALLFAASVTAAAGCGGRTTTVDPIPPPSDAAGDARHDTLVSDPMPIDAGQADQPWADPMPIDAGQADQPWADPMPIDAGQDDVLVADMMPPDGGYHLRSHELDPPPPLRTLPTAADLAGRLRDDLPLPRGLTVRIARSALPDGTVALRALTNSRSPRLSFTWMASAGVLSSTTAGEVAWAPPDGPGRHLLQVTVRDGERALAVDAIVWVR